MKVFNTRKELEVFRNSINTEKISIGFVPTMGALHKGHASLIRQSVAENKMTIVSIFVNPTQFDNNKDLDKYPRTFESDISLIKEIDKAIIIFAPTATELYQGEVVSKHYTFDGLEFEMEGKHREGHFDGVGTVLELFFKLVAPKNAYFGKKDFQQLQIVKKLVQNYNLNVNVIGCEIYRETSGLAMSSRNERLSSQARKKASKIYKILQEAQELFATKTPQTLENWVNSEFKKHKEFKLEYVSIADSVSLKPAINKIENKKYRLFIAVFIEDIRLIDNVALN